MRLNKSQVDSVLLGGAALTGGGLFVVAPWETACTAAIVMVLAGLFQRGSGRQTSLVLVALGIGGMRARSAVAHQEIARARIDEVAPRAGRCSAEARVEASPVSLRGAIRWDGRLTDCSCDSAPALLPPFLATVYGGPSDLSRGDTVQLVAALALPQRLWNPSSGDPRPGEAHRAVVRSGGALDVRVVRRGRGLLAQIDRARARVRNRIDTTFSPDLAPMARALVLGESDLAADDDLSFRASGLSHLLAVSGMHLVLVLAIVVRGLEESLGRVESIAGRWDVRRLAAFVGVPAAWVYAEFAGAGGSTLRAAWMATASLAACALGKRTDGIRGFGLSLAAMAIADPLVVFDLSFSLSAAATGGLLAFARPISAALESRFPSRVAPLARAIATTLAASLPCLPILARFAPTVAVGGVIANVFAVPIGECAALPLCLAHATLGWWPAAERGCALLASGALVLVRAIARRAALPVFTMNAPQPTSWQFAVCAVSLTAVALGSRWRRSVLCASAACILLLEIRARREGSPHGLLRATFLDVGQGDAALVDLPDGEAIVIDGGGLVGSPIDVGSRVLAPELRARRRRRLLAAVLTHPHPDHFGGLATGLSGIRVAAFWDTGEGRREGLAGAYATLIESMAARGVPVLGPDLLCGERLLGGARVEVLAPCPTFSSDRTPNDNSLVLKITYGQRAFLLAGDAEATEEDELLASGAQKLRADVLKVGHHGSRTSSSSAFLAAVAPKEAVVSVGRRNRFGHPSPATLEALRTAGARVWRTDFQGAVTVSTDGRSLDVRAESPDEPAAVVSLPKVPPWSVRH